MSYSIKVSPSIEAGTSSTVILPQRGNGNIFCTSSGNPVPSITWTINHQPTQLSQTDVTTNPTDTTTSGQLVSTLHIVNAQYQEHNGVFLCTGTSIISGSPRTDSASTTVVVLGKLIA